jgi:hypothetical protein
LIASIANADLPSGTGHQGRATWCSPFCDTGTEASIV